MVVHPSILASARTLAATTRKTTSRETALYVSVVVLSLASQTLSVPQRRLLSVCFLRLQHTESDRCCGTDHSAAIQTPSNYVASVRTLAATTRKTALHVSAVVPR